MAMFGFAYILSFCVASIVALVMQWNGTCVEFELGALLD